MNYSCWDRKRLSGLQMKPSSVREVDFQLSLQNKEAFIRVRMLVPAEFSLHHGQPNAMVVDAEDHEILVDLLDGSRLALQIHHG